jgi:hypothetical protein
MDQTALTPENILSAAILTQILFLIVLGIGAVGIRLGMAVYDGRAADPNIFANVVFVMYLVMWVVTVLVVGITESRAEALMGSTGFLSPMTGLHTVFIFDLVVITVFIVLTGGSGVSLFTSGLTFIPTILIFLTREFAVAFRYGAVILLLMAITSKIGVNDNENPQMRCYIGRGLSVMVRMFLMLLTLFIAYRNLFRAAPLG